jgi:hypothetical protein
MRVVYDETAKAPLMPRRRTRAQSRVLYLRAMSWIGLGWLLRIGSTALAFYAAYQVPDGRLLIFDAHWISRVLPPRRSLKQSLAPFFEQNGIELKERFLEAFLEHNGLRS